MIVTDEEHSNQMKDTVTDTAIELVAATDAVTDAVIDRGLDTLMDGAAGGCDGTLRVWDPATLQCLQVLQVSDRPAHTAPLNSVLIDRPTQRRSTVC